MEEKDIMFPITPDNFYLAWTWVDDKRRRAIARKWVRKTSGAVADLAFFSLLCIAAFGIYMQSEIDLLQAFLQKIPVLPQICSYLRQWIAHLGMWEQIAVIVAAIYLLTFGAAALAAGIVALCCRPKEKPVPAGGLRETARLLEVETERLVKAVKVKYRAGGVRYSALFLFLNAGLLSAFVLQLATLEDTTAVMEITQKLNGTTISVLVIGCWLGYTALFFPLMHLLRVLYILKLPQELLEQVRDYSLRCDPDRRARMEEEDRILAMAEQIKLRRRREMEEMLRQEAKIS